MSLARRAIDRPVATAMLFLAVVFLGLISFTRLPIDLLPSIAYPQLVVDTRYPNVGPAEVERFVTEPIEQAVSTVPGVERVSSRSREGESLVTLRFAWGANMEFAALNVREKLDNIRATLPELADRPRVLHTDPSADPIMAISLSGDEDLASLNDLAESVIRRRLEQVDGVAQAAVTGGLQREIHVDVDLDRLQAHGLTIEDIASALAAANVSLPGGTVLKGRYRYALRTLGEFSGVSQIGAVVVSRGSAARSGGSSLASAGLAAAGGGPGTGSGASPGGGSTVGPSPGSAAASGAGGAADSGQATVRLSDVASVSDGFAERQSMARYNGKPAVGLVVYKESGANTVRVAGRVNAVLAQLRKEFPKVSLTVASSQATFVSAAIANVVQSLIWGSLLAFLVLILFLRDIRYPIAIALSIPISVVATFALLDLANVSLNVMTLGGLALGVGMLVDNSIVVLENTFRLRERGAGAREGAAVGAEEVQGAITASTLTTIAVFGPIIYVQGVAGQLFGPLSLTVTFSLLASLVVALTLLPTMAARWRGTVSAGGERRGPLRRPLAAFDRGFQRFTELYERALAYSLEHRGRVLGGALATFVLCLALGGTLRRDVLPQVDQGSFTARLTLPRGTPLSRTARTAGRLEALIRAQPEVRDVFSRIGRQAAVQGVEDERSGPNTAVLDVRLKPGRSTAKVLARLRPALARFPTGAVAIETGSATQLGALLGGGQADLSVQVRGEDLNAALAYAQKVEMRLGKVPALANVRLGTQLGQPEVRVTVDRDRAAAFGLDPDQVARTVKDYMQGDVATQLVDFDRRVPVVVRLPAAERQSLNTLNALRIRGVPVGELVHVRQTMGPSDIQRVNQNQQVSVLADVASGGVSAATARVRAALASLPAPRGLDVQVGGENQELRQGFRALAFAFALAMLLVYMILAAQFESLLQPLVVLLTVPMALVGAVLALWVTRAGFNTLSLIGIVILVGIVNNDAVVKVDFINQMRRQGMSVRQAVIEAGHARLRPILMTTVTTLFGVLPMALGLGRGGELQAPLAIAVFGGLAASTALTLILIPIAYEIAESWKARTLAALGWSEAGEGAEAGASPLAWLRWRERRASRRGVAAGEADAAVERAPAPDPGGAEGTQP